MDVRRCLGWLGPLSIFLLLHFLIWIAPGVQISAFCRPVALAAASLMPAQLQEDDLGVPILSFLDGRASLRIGVTCSGTDFFILSSALGLWLLMRRRDLSPHLLGAALLVLLPLCYAVTLVINTCRVVAVSGLSPWMEVFLPERALALGHLSLGVFFFLPCLLAFVFYSERLLHVLRNSAPHSSKI
ncbi:MAG: hypothetical protein HC904_12415 [Blastochloris sp.]|nr:hypothetical protein [Blastochloris sp.]